MLAAGLAPGEAVVAVELELGGTFGLKRNTLIILLDPHKFLARVVEVEADLATITRQRVFAVELDLLNEVFVADLGEAAAFVRVEVDVVDVERGVLESGAGLKLNVDLDFVVLKSDERKRKARVAAEPELERDEERLRIVAGLSAGHVSVGSDLAVFLGEFVPEVHPFTVVLVNTLSADFDFNVFNEITDANRIALGSDGGDVELKVAAADEVAVARDGAGDLGARARAAVEGLFDRFHREVGVAAVDHLEEGDLGVTGQVNILGAVSDELHESSSHFVLVFFIHLAKKIIFIKTNAKCI